MNRIRDVYERITASADTHPLLGPGRAIVRWALLFYKKLQRDRAFVRAAGMAYASLIALVPFLLLIFGILSATGMLEANADTIEAVLFSAFLGDIPEVREFLLPGLLAVDLNTLGVVGVAGLLFVASRLMLMIERAYCDIYGVPVERPFFHRILNVYFAITALPLVALAVIITTKNALTTVDAPGIRLAYVTPVVLYCVFLGALKLFPSTRVRWRPALIGALVSTVLVTLASRVFPWYVSVFGSDDPLRIIYGSVGIIPVFLLWLYCMWMFVLLGVEVAYVIQNYGSLVEAEKEEWHRAKNEVRAVDVSVAIEAAMRVASAFMEGSGPVSTEDLARELGVSTRQTWLVLGVLEADGVLVRVGDDYTMARPPSAVSVAQVIGGWRRRTSVRASAVNTVADAVYSGVMSQAEGSLADAVERWLLADLATTSTDLVDDTP